MGGGAVNRQDPEATGLNPSWRKSLAQLYITEGWKDGTPLSQIKQLRQRLVEGTKVLDTVSVNSAAYLNEVHPHFTFLSPRHSLSGLSTGNAT